MDNAQAIALTLSTVGTSLGVYSQALPPQHAIAAAPAIPGNVAMVRKQCSQAALIALAIGAGASVLARSPWPLAGAATVAVWEWWQYDQAAQLDGLKYT